MISGIEATIPEGIEIELVSREIVYGENGTFTAPVDLTIRRAGEVLERIGIEEVSRSGGRGSTALPIVTLNRAAMKAKCHRAACLWARPPRPLNRPPREVYGKGVSEAQCLASAMMEAVERYSGQKFPHHRTIHARFDEIRAWALGPEEFRFPGVPLKCFSCVDRERGCFEDLHRVSNEWTWGYSLARKRPLLIPSAVVFYPFISEEGTSFMFNDTGGLSAGNTIEEAILHGIAEVVERDALFQAFNLGHLTEAGIVNCCEASTGLLRDCLNRLDPLESVFAFQVTNEVSGPNIPTFTAFSCHKGAQGRRYFGGSGTSLSPEVGLLRALTEMEQQKIRQGVLAGLERDSWVTRRDLNSEDGVAVKDLADRSTKEACSDIQIYLSELRKLGADTLVVNLTHPDLQIPAVRVIIPKLIAYSGSAIKEEMFLQGMRRFSLEREP
jgi:YcaO-like protein with predicted kinase domain